MDRADVEPQLARLEADCRLDDSAALAARRDALCFLDLIDELARLRGRWEDWASLKQRSGKLRRHLQLVDTHFFESFRARLRMGDWTPGALRQELDGYTAYRPAQGRPAHMGYDSLDTLLRGILRTEDPPPPTLDRAPEMIHLEATPARAILDLVDHVVLTPGDVFYDLGSGLGEVIILFHLLTRLPAVGIEYEPAYCRQARHAARDLGLSGVEFLNVDAREADYNAGTVFFMFTPFRGSILRAVLVRLRREARQRPIMLCSYGPSTPVLAAEPWLVVDDGCTVDEFHVVSLRSIPL